VPSNADERALVARLRDSDVGAYAELFDRLGPRLWRFSARQLGSADAAHDVVQDVFVSLWERRTTIDPEQNLNAYLYGAVRRRGLHYLRHEQSVAGSARNAAVALHAWRSAAPVGPDVATQAAEFEAALAGALGQLTELQRAALACRREGLSHAEIAVALEITTEAARKHVTRALATLKRVLERFDPGRG
jgi:RNA polymerase sigma-70 factor (ECF subfamily)